MPLLVRGAAESPELGAELTRLATRYPAVDFEDRFLSREEFAGHVRDAAVIVLPYTHFDAHSGVLAKAIGTGTRVVASDLASLREQNGAHSPARFADIHDRDAFAAALRQGFDDAVAAGPRTGADTSSRADWQPTVEAVLGAVPRG